MARYLPLIFLASTLSLFGIVWIIFDINPQTAPWYIFMIFTFLLFAAVLGYIGLLLFFIRTRFYRRYSVNWYLKTSFKMSFFISLFISLLAVMAFLKLITTLNLFLAIFAVSLFALWSYLGKMERD